MSPPAPSDKDQPWKSAFAVASGTHVGMRRRNNQDNHGVFLAQDESAWTKFGHLLIVADGMGAHAAGELASQLSVELIPHHYRKLGRHPLPTALEQSLIETNSEIFRRGQANPEFRSMGTTTCAMSISPAGAYIAHVGDSRVYRLRSGVMEQLTFDHSLVWEMRASGEITDEVLKNSTIPKNVITRSLGPNASVLVDVEGPFSLEKGDIFLLCSDGLSGQLDDDEMGVLLQLLDRDAAVQCMIDLANLRGGPDNITLVVGEVLCDGISKPNASSPAKKPSPQFSYPAAFMVATIIGVLLTLFLVVLGHYPIALVAAVATIATFTAGWQKFRSINQAGELPPTSRGTSPYRRVKCKPNGVFTENLGQVVRELIGWFEENGWSDHTGEVSALRAKATKQESAGQHSEAIKNYTQIILMLMRKARKQPSPSPDDSQVL